MLSIWLNKIRQTPAVIKTTGVAAKGRFFVRLTINHAKPAKPLADPAQSKNGTNPFGKESTTPLGD